MKVVSEILKEISIPRMIRIKQTFPRPEAGDIKTLLRNRLPKPDIAGTVKPGMSVAITAGSRGIANIALMLRETAAFLMEKGAKPFIVPAMGSHGGATAEGQLEILHGYGITEDYCGCPIISSMEVEKIGSTAEGNPVYIDRAAANADGIIVMNRIKPHTGYHGPYESGLMKMLAIGLAKRVGAETCHSMGMEKFDAMVPLFGKAVLANVNVIFGIAILENAYDETCDIAVLGKDEIEEKEPELLIRAKGLMPRLLFDSADVLIVDEIGKNISGDGMDPNIIGRYGTKCTAEGFAAQMIAVLRLSEETKGSGIGIGLADVSTRKMMETFDFATTYANTFTSLVPNVAKLPVIMDNDRDCVAAAIMLCVGIDRNNPRAIRIKNTLSLGEICISEALLEEAKGNPQIKILGKPEAMAFDKYGTLV